LLRSFSSIRGIWRRRCEFRHGYELWRSDGAAAGTQIVQDIYPGGNRNPQFLTNIGGTLLFAGTDPTNGTELWKAVP
jgi:ELWxxDGT repeat protein